MKFMHLHYFNQEKKVSIQCSRQLLGRKSVGLKSGTFDFDFNFTSRLLPLEWQLQRQKKASNREAKLFNRLILLMKLALCGLYLNGVRDIPDFIVQSNIGCFMLKHLQLFCYVLSFIMMYISCSGVVMSFIPVNTSECTSLFSSLFLNGLIFFLLLVVVLKPTVWGAQSI